MYTGHYINLKREKKRKKDLLAHFKELGISNYKRHEALLGTDIYKQFDSSIAPSSLGCNLSHLNLIKNNIGSDVHVHIIEDDVILHKDLPEMFEAGSKCLDWDVIYSDIYFSFLDPLMFFSIYEKHKHYKSTGELSFINLKGIPFSGASSYLINKNSIEKFYNLLNRTGYLNTVNSQYINGLVQSGELKAFSMVPFFSTLSENSEQSAIDKSYTSTMFAMDTLRRSLYVDANQKALQKSMKRHSNSLGISPHINIYADASKIVLNNLDKSHFLKLQ